MVLLWLRRKYGRVKFYALSGTTYEFKISNPEANADVRLDLYDTDATTILISGEPFNLGDLNGPGEGELLSWVAPADGIYYLRVSQAEGSPYGLNTGYDLRGYRPVLSNPGIIYGLVYSNLAQAELVGAMVSSVTQSSAISAANGVFELRTEAGINTLVITLPGYRTVTIDVAVLAGKSAHVIITLAMNDQDGDDIPDDYETANGLNPNVNDAGDDADGDGFTNLEEYRIGSDLNQAASNPGKPTFTQSTLSVIENAGNFVLPVVRGGGSLGAISVLCYTTDTAAQSGSDYVTRDNNNGWLTWSDGDASSKTCSVQIINDRDRENHEPFQLSLGSLTGGAKLGPITDAVITIRDDDRDDRRKHSSINVHDIMIWKSFLQQATQPTE